MSENLKTIAVWMAEMPSFIVRPTFPTPHAQLKFLTEQFPDQWTNFLDFMIHEGHCSVTTAKALAECRLERVESRDRGVISKVNEWMDFRMPTFKRTAAALCELRDRLSAGSTAKSFEIIKILWPKVIRASDPSNDAAARMGIEVVAHDPVGGSWDYGRMLGQSNADFLWIIPGGMKLNLFTLLTGSIQEILNQFSKQPSAGAFYDRHSTIHRASTLREIVRRRGSLPANRDKAAQIIAEEGYTLLGHPDADPRFTTIERIYVRAVAR